jgi:hypothetical protein
VRDQASPRAPSAGSTRVDDEGDPPHSRLSRCLLIWLKYCRSCPNACASLRADAERDGPGLRYGAEVVAGTRERPSPSEPRRQYRTVAQAGAASPPRSAERRACVRTVSDRTSARPARSVTSAKLGSSPLRSRQRTPRLARVDLPGHARSDTPRPITTVRRSGARSGGEVVPATRRRRHNGTPGSPPQRHPRLAAPKAPQDRRPSRTRPRRPRARTPRPEASGSPSPSRP